jgi:beta-lactamase regulating signal transducer with metallopeptidase domain
MALPASQLLLLLLGPCLAPAAVPAVASAAAADHPLHQSLVVMVLLLPSSLDQQAVQDRNLAVAAHLHHHLASQDLQGSRQLC